MKYQDLQLIWDQQAKHRIFTIDHDIVVTSVEEKCLSIEKGINWTEKALIIGSFIAGIPLTLEPFISRDMNWASFTVGIIFVIKGLFTWTLFRKRKQQERAYEQAVIPSIEKALFQNSHTATILKRWLVFFHIPAAIIAVIGLLFFPDGMTPWMWILFIGIVVYSIWDTPRYIRTKCQKEEKELSAIRSQLLEINQ